MPRRPEPKDNPEVVKIVFVPILRDENGVIELDTEPYHAILSIYPDDSWLPTARLDPIYSEETALEVAKLLAGNKPLEIDRDFFVRAFWAREEKHAEEVQRAELAEKKRKKTAH